MVLHTADNELTWEEVNHHVLNRVNGNIARVLQCEILYYKSEQVIVRSTLKLQEFKSGDEPFALNITSYTHVTPDILRLEFSETKHINNYASLEEAKQGAQAYYRSHYHAKQNHHYQLTP